VRDEAPANAAAQRETCNTLSSRGELPVSCGFKTFKLFQPFKTVWNDLNYWNGWNCLGLSLTLESLPLDALLR
jgi:hypothetical protein